MYDFYANFYQFLNDPSTEYSICMQYLFQQKSLKNIMYYDPGGYVSSRLVEEQFKST